MILDSANLRASSEHSEVLCSGFALSNEKMDMHLSCEKCDVYFTGILPYRDHMNSKRHQMKVNNPDSTPLMQVSLDEYITPHGNEYKCIKCNLILNSYQQAQTHVSGSKHRKQLLNPTLNNLKISDTSNNNPYSKLDLTFSFRDITIKNPLSDLKVIKIDDPICF